MCGFFLSTQYPFFVNPFYWTGSLVNEPLANEAFETSAEVEELVYQRCRRLLKQQELIRGLTAYHWWPGVSAEEAA